jgi:hypothetical protein
LGPTRTPGVQNVWYGAKEKKDEEVTRKFTELNVHILKKSSQKRRAFISCFGNGKSSAFKSQFKSKKGGKKENGRESQHIPISIAKVMAQSERRS